MNCQVSNCEEPAHWRVRHVRTINVCWRCRDELMAFGWELA